MIRDVSQGWLKAKRSDLRVFGVTLFHQSHLFAKWWWCFRRTEIEAYVTRPWRLRDCSTHCCLPPFCLYRAWLSRWPLCVLGSVLSQLVSGWRRSKFTSYNGACRPSWHAVHCGETVPIAKRGNGWCIYLWLSLNFSPVTFFRLLSKCLLSNNGHRK